MSSHTLSPQSLSPSFSPFEEPNLTVHASHHRTPELISAIDLFYQRRLILSRVVETETKSGWFRCSPFRVDLLDPKDSVETGMEYPRNDEACGDLEEELKLSWIVIDPRGKRAVNVLSGKPVSVQRHWLTGEVQVRFATVLGGGERGTAKEVALCSLMVTLGGEMQVKEACFQMEDMDGVLLNERDSLGILQRALDGGRRLRDEKEGRGWRQWRRREGDDGDERKRETIWWRGCMVLLWGKINPMVDKTCAWWVVHSGFTHHAFPP